jgi:hypothetical protein
MKRLLSIALAAAAWTAAAQGTFQAVLNYSGESPAFVDGTAGWTFQTTGFISVTDLGCFDSLFASNPGGIEVGLWAPDGTLVASNTVTSASTLAGATRYESITPVLLDPGSVYHLGAFYPSNTFSLTICAPVIGGSFVTSPQIQVRGSASTSSGFAFPAEEGGANGALYLGPNFRYRIGVPEPSTWMLLGLAGLLTLARQVTRR